MPENEAHNGNAKTSSHLLHFLAMEAGMMIHILPMLGSKSRRTPDTHATRDLDQQKLVTQQTWHWTMVALYHNQPASALTAKSANINVVSQGHKKGQPPSTHGVRGFAIPSLPHSGIINGGIHRYRWFVGCLFIACHRPKDLATPNPHPIPNQ